MKVQVENMTSSRGNKIANQFIIRAKENGQCGWVHVVFQSYESVIVQVEHLSNGEKCVLLDTDKWDYSVTTGKYRNQFLGETKKETQAKIDSGEYLLADLN